jgi:hypothetical protein
MSSDAVAKIIDQTYKAMMKTPLEWKLSHYFQTALVCWIGVILQKRTFMDKQRARTRKRARLHSTDIAPHLPANMNWRPL